MRIAIVGGGMLGLSLALELSRRGYPVHVIEAEPLLGGLAAAHDYGPFRWDRFYHCILPGDRELLHLVEQLGLGDDVVWRRTSTGFLADGAVYPMNGPLDLWRFPLLGPVDKARLALTSLWAARFARPERLERISAAHWLTRLCGRRAFGVFWEPLLRAKFGDYADRVAAVFLWATLRRLSGARGRLAGGEQLGYVRGGYGRILEAIESALRRHGAEVTCGARVTRIVPLDGPTAGCRLILARSGGRDEIEAEHVVFTAPSPLARTVCDPRLHARIDAWESAHPPASVYLGVLCQVLALPRPLTRHYVVNIGGPRTELTGIIEMTSIIDRREETAGRHLVYLPRYVASDDPLLDESDEQVSERLLTRGLLPLFADLRIDDAEYRGVHRARFVQPLPLASAAPRPAPVPLALDPPFQLLNTACLRCATLNNNEVVALAREMATAIDRSARGAGR